MILRIESCEGYVTRRLRVNNDVGKGVFETFMRPRIPGVSKERVYSYQQDPVPSDKVKTTKELMSYNMHNHVTPNI